MIGELAPGLVVDEVGRLVEVGVVSWRLFEFCAPIPVAGLCYTSLRTQKWWNRRGHRAAWAEFTGFSRHPRDIAPDPVLITGEPPP